MGVVSARAKAVRVATPVVAVSGTSAFMAALIVAVRGAVVVIIAMCVKTVHVTSSDVHGLEAHGNDDYHRSDSLRQFWPRSLWP